jgi:hypothetical protein
VGLNQIRILLDSHWRIPGEGRSRGRPTRQEHAEPAGGILVNPTGRHEGLVVQPCTITAFAGQHLAVRRPVASSSHPPIPARRRRDSRPGESRTEWEQPGTRAVPPAEFRGIQAEQYAQSIHEGIGDNAQGAQVTEAAMAGHGSGRGYEAQNQS